MPVRLMEQIRKASLEKKIFFSSMAVILSLSFVIAILSRWVLVSNLTSELQKRGLGIAHSIAKNSQGHIKTGNVPALSELLVDARSGHRMPLVAYVFILDQTNKVLSHTFSEPFPNDFRTANPIKEEQSHANAGDSVNHNAPVVGHAVAQAQQ